MTLAIRQNAPCRAVLGLLLVWGCCGGAPSALATNAPLSRSASDLATITSPGGHFSVTGMDRVGAMWLAHWADKTLSRTSQFLGFELEGPDGLIHISLREAGEQAPGTVMAAQGVVGGRLAQRLVIVDMESAPREAAEEALCALLLGRHVLALWLKGQGGVSGAAEAEERLRATPPWLATGVAQNLHPQIRARNSRAVLDRWQRGELPSLAALLSNVGDDAAAEPRERARAVRVVGAGGTGAGLDVATAGMLVGWLAAEPGSELRSKAMLARLAEGGDVSRGWLATVVPGCDTAGDLDDRWDAWILRQKRTIYQPGVTTPDALQWLESELLLYRGESGIPLTLAADVTSRVGLGDLIEARGSEWVRTVARNKSARLRLLSVGRGRALKATVDAYCRYFDALVQGGGSDARLRRLLEAAEVENDRLKDALENERGD